MRPPTTSRQLLLVALSSLSIATACTPTGSGGDIAGTWLYESYTDGGETVEVTVDVNAASGAYLVIEGNQISGESGCNSFGGEVEYSNGVLRAGEIFSTLAGCLPETLMDAELAFHDLMRDGGAIEVSVDGETMRWRRGDAMLTFTHTDEFVIAPSIPPQTSFGALDCGDDEVLTHEIPSEGTTAEEVAFEADDRVTGVTVESDLGHFATGFDVQGNVVVVIAFQDVDPFPFRVYTCPG